VSINHLLSPANVTDSGHGLTTNLVMSVEGDYFHTSRQFGFSDETAELSLHSDVARNG